MNPNTGATGSAINIIFDGPPGPEAGRLVEVETDDGKSINAGEWMERPDGLWALRITRLPNAEAHVRAVARTVQQIVGGSGKEAK